MEQRTEDCTGDDDVDCCLQLYKTREGKYLLDIQRVEGPSFLFMDLCTTFLAEVGAV